MPGKHVRFDLTSTPQSDRSPSFSPTSFNQSGSTYDKPLHPVEGRISLTPSLSTRERHIHWDLTLPPENARVHPGFINDRATKPALPSMTIMCEALPRPISVVESQRGYGVTVMDVLRTIYTSLRVQFSEADFRQLSPDMQQRVSDAYQHRYRSIGDEKVRAIEKLKGLKLVDLLGRKKVFAGLQSTMRGPDIWELCLSSS